MERILEMTELLTNAFGAPGFEDDVLEIIKNYASEFEMERSSINNLYKNTMRTSLLFCWTVIVMK